MSKDRATHLSANSPVHFKVKSIAALSRREFIGGAAGLGLAASASESANAAPAVELPVTPRELWPWVRAQQMVDPSVAYLDTGTFGPGLRAGLATEFRHQELFNSDPDAYQRTYFSSSAISAVTARFASLLGCDASEVTLTRGATEALNIVANGLALNAGDEVIVTNHAHGSALYPWILQAQRRGIVVKHLTFPSPTAVGETLGRIAAAVTDKTRVITLSHLQHTDGAVLPIADICAFAKQRNIFSVVDGAQACGAIQFSMSTLGCDFYAASLHKWINAPLGHGLLFVRRELLEALTPMIVDSNASWSAVDRYGQASIDDGERSEWPNTLRKFSDAMRTIGPRLKSIEAALDFREQVGAERIESRIRELAIYARLRLQPLTHLEILTPNDPGAWSGILTFKLLHASAKTLVDRCNHNEKITVRSMSIPYDAQTPHIDVVRICTHIYDSHEDIDRFVRVVQQSA